MQEARSRCLIELQKIAIITPSHARRNRKNVVLATGPLIFQRHDFFRIYKGRGLAATHPERPSAYFNQILAAVMGNTTTMISGHTVIDEKKKTSPRKWKKDEHLACLGKRASHLFRSSNASLPSPPASAISAAWSRDQRWRSRRSEILHSRSFLPALLRESRASDRSKVRALW